MNKTATLLTSAFLAVAAVFLGPMTSQAATSPCAITQAKLIGNGGMQDWSHANDLIAYSQKDSIGNYQLHTVHPDGTGDFCVSCNPPAGAPGVNRHKVGATWSADGKWIVVAVENAWQPFEWWRTADWVDELIINGMATELWAVSPDGKQWSQLTRYSSLPSTDPGYALGVMQAHFSDDGTKLVWSKMVGATSSTAPWGTYRLMMANFVIGSNGLPTLQNVQDVTPATATPFVEAHNFSADGKSILYSSYASPTNTNNMDIFKLDLATKTSTQLTTNTNWDEHAYFSPSGNKIAYMAGQLGVWMMSADLMIMDANGANPQRLTAFNQAGQPGYTGQLTMVAQASWNATGTRMAVSEQLANGYPSQRRVWVLNFAGTCGG